MSEFIPNRVKIDSGGRRMADESRGERERCRPPIRLPEVGRVTTTRKRRKRRITESQRGQVFELLERGLSQAEAAREAKVSEASVSRLAHERKRIPRPQPEAAPEPRRPDDGSGPEYADIDVSSKPDIDAGESGMFDFEIPATDMSAVTAELASDDAPLAGRDAVVPDRNVEGAVRPVDPGAIKGQITVAPEHPGQFPVADPWPPRELNYAGQAALLRTPHRPKPPWSDRLMLLFQNGR